MTAWSQFILAGASAFAISALLVPGVRKLAVTIGAVDHPGEARRIHTKATPRLGGLAIYIAFLVVVLAMVPWSRQLAGVLAGCTILVIVGAIDDVRSLSPWVKLFWQILAACVALAGGIGIATLTNPFGGTVDLSLGRTAIDLFGFSFHITPIANAISLIWMVGLINTVNFLDGLDGLATGVSGIAAFIMFLLAVGPNVNQPIVALLAIALAGAAFGFLPYNFFPARIFLGDSGSQLLGLMLAMLAIYSGAKLATAALVLGFTIIDGLWTVLRRIRRGVSPFKADRGHFHHLLLDAGLSQTRAVIIMYLIALTFGLVALTIGSYAKLVALIILLLFMAGSIAFLALVSARKTRS
jgi:UDP-GlcNAc:undecaprenyl-phosphate GlcNAc-1-phosphate transferase